MTTQACVGCGLRFQCICDAAPHIEAPFRLMLLMHPNEQHRDTNTGKLLAQTLSSVEQYVWHRTEPPQALMACIQARDIYPVLLFPSEQSVSLREQRMAAHQQNKQPLFIILDATWQEARKMVNKSPWLKAMPTLSLDINTQSRYSLRRNQQQGSLCTCEVGIALLEEWQQEQEAKDLHRYFNHYLAAYQADKSGHALKGTP